MHHPLSPCRPRPPRPPAEPGVLLHRIVSRERLSLPCLQTELCVQDLPCSAQPPYRLHSVRACGQTAVHVGSTPGTVILTIPLLVQLCAACSRSYTASASIEVETRAPRSMDQCCHHMVWAAPEVRLLESAQGDGCFCVRLSILADLYLLRLEPCMTRALRPACPQLPLYPPPMC